MVEEVKQKSAINRENALSFCQPSARTDENTNLAYDADTLFYEENV